MSSHECAAADVSCESQMLLLNIDSDENRGTKLILYIMPSKQIDVENVLGHRTINVIKACFMTRKNNNRQCD